MGVWDHIYDTSHLILDTTLIVYTKAVVELLSKSSYFNNAVVPLVDDCRQMLSQLTQFGIRHCYREVNSCADFPARIGTNQIGTL